MQKEKDDKQKTNEKLNTKAQKARRCTKKNIVLDTSFPDCCLLQFDLPVAIP
jgi:hypothetical protein